MKPFDEKFGENVREVFDNYREPVDEQAWQQMKTRLRGRSKTSLFVMTPVFVRAAAAVALLMAVSGSLWLLLLNPEKPDMTTVYEQHEESPAYAEDAPGDTPSGSAVQEDVMHEVSPGHADITTQTGTQQHSVATAISEGIPDNENIAKTVTGTGETLRTGETAGTLEITGALEIAITHETERTPPPPGLPSLSEISGLYSRVVSSDLMSTGQQPVADADAFIISRNLESLADAGTGSHRNSIVEVSAGSMKTWSPQEIAGGIGYAAGVGGDWPVGNRFSISGGGLLVYNQFSLSNTMVPARSFSDTKLDAAPETGLSPGYQVVQYETSDTDVEFTALDIPLNLRFTVRDMPGSRIFLSAGFSSFLYLQQKYSSESTVLASFYRMNPQGHYMTETSHANLTSEGEFKAFRRLDLARFLNLSGGYVIRGRNQSLIIEPFLKYPLGDITTLNLNIGMAGLSLKYLPGSR